MTDVDIKKIFDELERRIGVLETILLKKNSVMPIKHKLSITDKLIELRNSGFFDKPKSTKEIAEKLAEGGFTYPQSSLTDPLQRLVRKHELGRLKHNNIWGYVKR